jgi:hypothetical protein
VLDDQLAELGQYDAARLPIKQLDAQGRLKHLDALAQCGLRELERRCGAMEGPVLGEGNHVSKASQREPDEFL